MTLLAFDEKEICEGFVQGVGGGAGRCSISTAMLAQLQEQRCCDEMELKQILISHLLYLTGELRLCVPRMN